MMSILRQFYSEQATDYEKDNFLSAFKQFFKVRFNRNEDYG